VYELQSYILCQGYYLGIIIVDSYNISELQQAYFSPICQFEMSLDKCRHITQIRPDHVSTSAQENGLIEARL
jgi:hypothetical protein